MSKRVNDHRTGENTMASVYDYNTNDNLGPASEELAAASDEALPVGAVAAYRDNEGTWQYVPEDQEDHYKRNLGRDVRTVYVL
jgi:hypothetical protein